MLFDCKGCQYALYTLGVDGVNCKGSQSTYFRLHAVQLQYYCAQYIVYTFQVRSLFDCNVAQMQEAGPGSYNIIVLCILSTHFRCGHCLIAMELRCRRQGQVSPWRLEDGRSYPRQETSCNSLLQRYQQCAVNIANMELKIYYATLCLMVNSVKFVFNQIKLCNFVYKVLVLISLVFESGILLSHLIVKTCTVTYCIKC